MSSSPLQFMDARTQPHPPIARPLTPLPQAQAPDRCRHGPTAPSHARHLVGERNCHDLEGSSRQKLREPGIFFGVLLRVAQDRMSANDENASQIAIALLGDRPELLLAAGRIL